jgi:hypothetical protein
VLESVSMNVTGVVGNFTVLRYTGVPLIVAEEVDAAMDDRELTRGAVQWVTGNLTIIIARQGP